MNSWQEAFDALQPEKQERVMAWMALETLVASVLRMDLEKWLEGYVGHAADHPLDYSFVKSILPEADAKNFAEVLAFDREAAAKDKKSADLVGIAIKPVVPLRAPNKMGRLSPGLQDQLQQIFSEDILKTSLMAADVVVLQKIFAREKKLNQLKRPDFSGLSIERESEMILIKHKTLGVIVQMPVLECALELQKTN